MVYYYHLIFILYFITINKFYINYIYNNNNKLN